MRLRRRVYEVLERAEGDDRVSRFVDISLMIMILASVAAVILETVPAIQEYGSRAFYLFNVFTVAVFSVEYLLRIWVSVEKEESGPGAHWLIGRVRYVASPMALVDLLAILPFYLPFLGIDLRSMRALRLFRMLRIFKFSRYSQGVRVMMSVIKQRKPELVAAVGMLSCLLVLAASVIYYAEREMQPEAFSSIPAAMWWAIATLTTVGYGDVYPITLAGRFFGAVTAVAGLLIIALPTGIIGAGFVSAFEEERTSFSADDSQCPTCGRTLKP